MLFKSSMCEHFLDDGVASFNGDVFHLNSSQPKERNLAQYLKRLSFLGVSSALSRYYASSSWRRFVGRRNEVAMDSGGLDGGFCSRRCI